MGEPDRLLQMYRVRARLTQAELGKLLGLTSRMILNWEAGTNLPRPDALKNLIAVYVERGVFRPDKKIEEAKILWAAVKDARDNRNSTSSSFYPDFDYYWFTQLAENAYLSPAKLFNTKENTSSHLPPLQPVSHNLPLQLTNFVGREKDIFQVKTLLLKTHLLTLYGAGGVGKTRLCLRVAGELLNQYSDGVWFVQFAGITDPALVVRETAHIVGVKDSGKASLIESLSENLTRKQILLILDNCEHLVEAITQMADVLLKTCPYLKILATSREILNLAGETSFRVPSLSLPNLDKSASLEEIASAEAVQLFFERTTKTHPGFELTSQNKGPVIQICHQLNGIPLALELAAAQVKGLSVAQIADRLTHSFRLLTGGNRNVLPRQQTLQATLDWSYNLLTKSEQVLLRRLTIFAGSWTVEACETMCLGIYQPEENPLPVPEFDVLEMLLHLVNKSMVFEEEYTGVSRYRLLEIVRQFARDKLLGSQEEEWIKTNHLDYYLQLAKRIEVELGKSDNEFVWLEIFEKEHANFQEALGFAVRKPAYESLLIKGFRLSLALFEFWRLRGFWSEGREWLEKLLQGVADEPETKTALTNGVENMPPNQELVLLRMQAILFAGILAKLQGDYSAARNYLEQSAAFYRKTSDSRALAQTLLELAPIFYELGNSIRAEELCQESLYLFKEVHYGPGFTETLEALARLAWVRGETEKALHLTQVSLTLLSQWSDKKSRFNSLSQLVTATLEQGNDALAHPLLEQLLTLERERGSKPGIALRLEGLGAVCRRGGDTARANIYYAESLNLHNELGNRPGVASVIGNLGYVALKEGNLSLAMERFEESINLWWEMVGLKGAIAWCLEGLAEANTINNPIRAARLFGAAEALRETLNTPLPIQDRAEYFQTISALRTRLDDTTFQSSWTEGRGMLPQQAIRYAITFDVLTSYKGL